jgi:hypothetical protein
MLESRFVGEYFMESASAGLQELARKILRSQPAGDSAVLAWPLVCGKEVAARTRAAGFTEGRLTVEVPDAAWIEQLISFLPSYLRGFAQLLGPVVQEIRFVKQT